MMAQMAAAAMTDSALSQLRQAMFLFGKMNGFQSHFISVVFTMQLVLMAVRCLSMSVSRASMVQTLGV